VPAEGTRAAFCRKRRLRYVAVFFAQLSDKPLLARIWLGGVSDVKRNGGSRINPHGGCRRAQCDESHFADEAICGTGSNTVEGGVGVSSAIPGRHSEVTQIH